MSAAASGRRRRAGPAALALLAGAALAAPARAHDFPFTDVLIVLKADGTYQVDMTVDVDALAVGAPPGADSAAVAAELEALSPSEFEIAIERARDTLLRRVRLRFDDADKERPFVAFPELEAPLGTVTEPTVLGVTARLAGRVPPGAAELTFGVSRAFGVVRLAILEQTTLGGAEHTLVPGEDCPPYRLGQAPREAPGRQAVATRYLVLGFRHILPDGADHVLFVLGLFLLAARWRPLLAQVTAFTVAHSVTLALSMYDVVSLPSRPVETLIALSIAYVALENLVTSELKPWRPALVFGFGLLHGLGFAGALRELGLPREEFVTALVAFNAGVELGQLAVVGLAFLLLGAFRERRWYRAAVVLPLSGGIGLVGLWWAFERALGGG